MLTGFHRSFATERTEKLIRDTFGTVLSWFEPIMNTNTKTKTKLKIEDEDGFTEISVEKKNTGRRQILHGT